MQKSNFETGPIRLDRNLILPTGTTLDNYEDSQIKRVFNKTTSPGFQTNLRRSGGQLRDTSETLYRPQTQADSEYKNAAKKAG